MTTARPESAPRPDSRPAGASELRLSVWPTAQRDARTQRRGRYLPESVAHPAKMLPAIAATAIRRYTEPGDLVADPMCGIGTTLVEAVHLGRDGLGIEYEERWASLAAANAAGARAGLVPVARCVALLAGLRGGRLIARPSFFQLDNLRRARRQGHPWHLIVHEDVLIFRNPPNPRSPAAARLRPAHE